MPSAQRWGALSARPEWKPRGPCATLLRLSEAWYSIYGSHARHLTPHLARLSDCADRDRGRGHCRNRRPLFVSKATAQPPRPQSSRQQPLDHRGLRSRARSSRGAGPHLGGIALFDAERPGRLRCAGPAGAVVLRLFADPQSRRFRSPAGEYPARRWRADAESHHRSRLDRAERAHRGRGDEAVASLAADRRMGRGRASAGHRWHGSDPLCHRHHHPDAHLPERARKPEAAGSMESGDLRQYRDDRRAHWREMPPPPISAKKVSPRCFGSARISTTFQRAPASKASRCSARAAVRGITAGRRRLVFPRR